MEVRRYKNSLSNDQRALHAAVVAGSLERVRELFQPFSELNEEKKWFDYWLLIEALRGEHTDIANFLIENNCTVNIPEKTKQYCTPLYYACKVEHYKKETIELLIKKGASIRDKDFETKSTIEFAIEKKPTSLIDIIVQSCSSLFEEDRIEENADIFQLACWRGNIEIVQEFISKGINVNSLSVLGDSSMYCGRKWRGGFTPLHFAVYGNQTAICRLLLKHGADIHAKDGTGDTALHLAFKENRQSMFFCDSVVEEYLNNLRNSNFSNPQDKRGISHFHIICSSHVFRTKPDTAEQKRYMEQHLKIIQFYLDKKVDINISVPLEHPQYSGYAALHFAVSSSALEISKLLLHNGADLKKVDGAGHTPLHLLCKIFKPNKRFKYPAYQDDNQAIVELLLGHGANRDDADPTGSTPLHLAFCNEPENNSVLDLLLSKKLLDVNITNDEGLSYFHIACSVSNLSTVKTLVSRGASVNSRVNIESSDFKAMSALHFAVSFNQKEIVNFLLAHGAEVNFKVPHSITAPLHLACTYTYRKFFKFSYRSDRNSNPDRYKVNWETNRKDQYDIILSLLKYGAAVNEMYSDMHTPLSLACRTPIGSIMEDYHGSDVEKEYHRKCILNEIRIRQEHTVKVLLEHGANIRAHNRPLLHGIVIDMLDPETFSIGENLLDNLLEKGANINSAFPESLWTVLHFASRFTPKTYALESISKLLEQPTIKVDAQSSSGETPLHFAVRACRSTIVKKLLESGADVNIVNNENDSPVKVLCDILRDRNWDSRGFNRIHHEFMLHVKRLVKLNIFTSAQNKRCVKTLVRLNDFPSSWPTEGLDEKIDTELEALKSRKIDSHTSLFDILHKNANEMSRYVRNVVFKEIMESPELLIEYPVFHVMLRAKYRMGTMRNLMLESSRNTLSALAGINLPVPCSDIVLKYLSNSDLETLSELKIHRKSLKRKANKCPPRGKKSSSKKSRTK